MLTGEAAATQLRSDPTPDVDVDVARGMSRRPVLVAVAILVLAVTAAAGLLAGSRLSTGAPAALGAPTAAAPVEGSLEAGFARDMSTHHTQAVAMSVPVLERSQDEQVRTLARDVLLTQQQQVGQMYAWLEAWGLPQTSTEAAMSWMSPEMANGSAAGGTASTGAGGHEGMAMGQPSDQEAPGPAPDAAGTPLMPGMASAEDLQRLQASTGPAADLLYLQLMLPHHRAGVAMAQAAAERATDPGVQRLARSIAQSQAAELAVLDRMLTDRGVPLPSPVPGP